jgi:hypothetical protein
MVGSAIVRELQRQGYTNIITRPHKELDLTRQTSKPAPPQRCGTPSSASSLTAWTLQALGSTNPMSPASVPVGH